MASAARPADNDGQHLVSEFASALVAQLRAAAQECHVERRRFVGLDERDDQPGVEQPQEAEHRILAQRRQSRLHVKLEHAAFQCRSELHNGFYDAASMAIGKPRKPPRRAAYQPARGLVRSSASRTTALLQVLFQLGLLLRS